MNYFHAVTTASLICLAIGLGGAPTRVSAGVFDSCAAWWHFDYDPNADGLAGLDEIRDQCVWGTTALKGPGGRHATHIHGALGGPQWTNEPTALRTDAGQNFGGKSMLFHPAINAATNVWPDTFQVSTFSMPGSASLVTRFRWEGLPAPAQQSVAWLYNNALDWTNKKGWLFGIRYSTFNRLSVYMGQTEVVMPDIAVQSNLWYTAAIVLTDGGSSNPTDTIEFYLLPETGGIQYRKTTTTALTNAVGTIGTIVGCEAYPDSYGSGNAQKAFVGAVNHLAVWNRPLSYSEVLEAFSYPQSLIQIGLNNNSVFDLRPESETDAVYQPGEPWHTLRRAITSGYREATLQIPLTNYQTRLNYAFHVKTTTDNGNTAGLSLIVNTTTNSTRTASPNKDLFWLVSSNQLVTGANTFTLRYESGSSPYIGFDWQELGGAWQVGYEDNNQAEFSIESSAPDDFFVTDPNWMHLERAITSGDTNVMLHFSLSPELVKKYYFTYTTRIIGQGPGGTNHSFSVEFNNTTLTNSNPVANGTYLSFPLNPALVMSTDNVIKVRYNDSPSISGYLQFDFHRLSMAEAPKGTLIRVR